MARTPHGHPPSFESSKVGWHQLGPYWSLVPCRVKWGAHAVTVALQSHTWTRALGVRKQNEAAKPVAGEEQVGDHKELLGG